MNWEALRLKNNIVQGSVANYYISANPLTSSNNISQDATSPDAAYRNKVVTFVDEGNDDLHLASNDSVARNYGLDLSGDSYLPFSNDIDGQTRPGETAWDIGADEYVPVGGFSIDVAEKFASTEAVD